MPELPEVETVVRGLRRRVAGARIERVILHQPLIVRGRRATFRRALTGARIAGLERRGKFIVFHLEAPGAGACRWCLVAHLGMTGQLYCCPPGWPRALHTHASFVLDTGEEMRLRDPRRFGRLEAIPAAHLEAYFAHLGPEPFDLTVEELARRIAGRRAAVKSLLLDQRLVRGLGNIYSDEALYLARIHPAVPAGALDAAAVRRLYAAIQRVLRAAIAAEGTSFSDYVTADGRLGEFQYRLRVYGREGKRCRRCGTLIERLVIGGRSSHFCPSCQPRRRRGQRSRKGRRLREGHHRAAPVAKPAARMP